MRQAVLQLKTRVQSVNIMNNNFEVEHITLNVMLFLLGTLAFLYVFILGSTVFNIVARKALEKNELTLSNEVGDLETSYLSLSKSVDLSLSQTMGFKETKATFATRKSLGSLQNVKFNQNEI